MILSKIVDVVKVLRSVGSLFSEIVNIFFKLDTPGKRKIATATSCIIVFGAVFLLILDHSTLWLPAAQLPPPPTCPKNATTVYGERYLLLDDGSEISLEAGSELCYDSKLSSEGSRDVGMHHGAAYFEVQHNPQNPFTITTPQGVVIKVRGTGLAVNVNEFLKTVDVAVTHGLVDVSYRDHTSEITSGQRISIDLATKDKNITAFDASRMNHLSFDDIPLDTFARILEQRFHTPVRFAKEKLKKLRVNGDFVNDEIRLRHILRSMEGALTSYNLELRLEGSSVVIREKPKQYIPG